MKVSGCCYCGQISFEAEIQPDKVRVCHCTDCQTLSGSAFRTNVPVVQGTFVLKKGEPKTFFKSGDSGNRIVHAFCPNCGTPIYSAVPGEPPGYSLRVGTLDRRAELVPSRQIWWRSALPWTRDLNLPGTERLDRRPHLLHGREAASAEPRRYGQYPTGYDALARRVARSLVRASSIVRSRRAGPRHRLGRACQRRRI